jgi:uncharacterized protein YkwD
MRKVVALIIAALAVLLLVACTPDEANHLQMVNAFRAEHGVPQLGWDDPLYDKARAWSQHMADQGGLSHSNLKDGAPGGWHILGENVAYNSSLTGAVQALEASPAHRANLLNSQFTRVAIGIIFAKNVYWVTEEFVG